MHNCNHASSQNFTPLPYKDCRIIHRSLAQTTANCLISNLTALSILKSSPSSSSLHKTKECSRSLSINPFVDRTFPWLMTKSHTKLKHSTSSQIVWMRRLAVLQTSDKLRCLHARWYLSYKFLILLNELRRKKFPLSAFFFIKSSF